MKIPQDFLLQWIGIVEQIKAQNQLLDERTKEIMEYFESQGKRCCILKGQGNALMYPEPKLRTPGDIDVWINGTKKEVVRFVHQRFPNMNVQYHHMNYPVFDDVEVEIHYYPSFSYNKLHNYHLQRYFRDSSDVQFNNIKYNGFLVPTNGFNIVFQLSHMMRHFFTQGIGLRHAIDYYYLLEQDLSEEEKKEAVRVIIQCGIYKFFCAILWIETSILGLKKNADIALANSKAGELVLQEMLKGGNFGRQYQARYKNIILVYAHQILYRMKFLSEFPSEPISRPMALTWDYLKKHVLHLDC